MTRMHQLLMSSWKFRIAGVLVLLWIAGVFVYAAAAWEAELDAYSLQMMFLLIVGVPLGLAATVYAAVLAGARGTVVVLSVVALMCLVGTANHHRQKNVRAEAAEQNRRATDLANFEFLKASEAYGDACRTQLERETPIPDARVVDACAQAAQLLAEGGAQQALEGLRADLRAGFWLDEPIDNADAESALEAAKVVHSQIQR